MQDNWQEFDRQMTSVLHDAEEKAPRRVWRAVSARLDSAAAAASWWRWAVPAFVAAAVVAGLFLAGTFDKAVPEPGNISILADNVNSDVHDASDALLASAPAESASMDTSAPESAALSFMRPERRSSTVPKVAANDGREGGDIIVESVSEAISGSDASKLLADAGQEREETVKTADAEDNSGIAAQWARIEMEEHQRGANEIRLRGLYAQGSVGGNDSNISYGGNGISRMAPGSGSVNAGISESGPSTYGVPFTVGLGVKLQIGDKLWLGTGLDYSLLTRTFSGSYNGNSADKYDGSIYHSLQYIGIPVNAYYDLLKTRDNLMQVYAWGGAEAEYCLSNRYRLMELGSTVIKDAAGGLQFSAAMGLGLEFKLSDELGLYLDPSVRYYFHGNQPKSVRTDKPFMFNFNAGLRFNF